MRTRLVDIALIAGLVAVAGAIMWTLFNLGGSPRPSVPATTPPAQTTPAQTTPVSPGQQALPSPPGAGGVVPVDPNDPNATAPVDTATPGSPEAGAPTDPVVLDTPQQPPATTPAAEPLAPEAGRAVAAADAAPVPSGTVGLERVGFSYVTGGAGACGVVLEPWQHIAVSRELLDAYGCGAQVTVTLDDPADGRSSFTATVADTMNPQFSRTANVYVSTDEDAFAYGLTSGSITPAE